VEFGTEDRNWMTSITDEFRENRCNNVLLKGVSKHFSIFSKIFRPICIRFGAGDLHICLLRDKEFHENRGNESHGLLIRIC
jgi:hypothetical protein